MDDEEDDIFSSALRAVVAAENPTAVRVRREVLYGEVHKDELALPTQQLPHVEMLATDWLERHEEPDEDDENYKFYQKIVGDIAAEPGQKELAQVRAQSQLSRARFRAAEEERLEAKERARAAAVQAEEEAEQRRVERTIRRARATTPSASPTSASPTSAGEASAAASPEGKAARETGFSEEAIHDDAMHQGLSTWNAAETYVAEEPAEAMADELDKLALAEAPSEASSEVPAETAAEAAAVEEWLADGSSAAAEQRAALLALLASVGCESHADHVRPMALLDELYDRSDAWSLGRGVSGAVSTCVKRATGVSYALKTMAPDRENYDETTALRNLLEDVGIQRSLSHPNIARARHCPPNAPPPFCCCA